MWLCSGRLPLHCRQIYDDLKKKKLARIDIEMIRNELENVRNIFFVFISSRSLLLLNFSNGFNLSDMSRYASINYRDIDIFFRRYCYRFLYSNYTTIVLPVRYLYTFANYYPR